MPDNVSIKITATDNGASKAIDNVTASQRKSAKQAKETADAQVLAAKLSGDAVTEQTKRTVKAREAEKLAAQELAKVQVAIRKGYLDEATAAQSLAAATQRLVKARAELAALAVPSVAPKAMAKEEEKIGAHAFLRQRFSAMGEDIGISEGMTGAAIGIAAVTVAAGELVAKMREVVSSAMDFGEEMTRANQKTGLAVETLSVLRYAAETTGGDFDGMTAAVSKMGITLAQAAEGNKTALAFLDSIGVKGKAAVRALAESPEGADTLWKKFTDAMNSAQTSTERLALAKGLLGKAGAEQIPVVMELAKHWDEYSQKAAAAGMVLNGDTASSLAETDKKMKEMRQSIEGAGVAFTEGLTPAINSMLDAMAGGQSHMEMFKSIGEGIGTAMHLAAAGAYDFAGGMAGIAKINALLHADPVSFMRWRDVTAEDHQESADQLYEAINGHPRVWTAPRKPHETSDGKPYKIPTLGGGVDKEAEKRLKAMEVELAQAKINGNATLKWEYDFWDARRNAFKEGSEQYNQVVEKQAQLAVEGATKAHDALAKMRAQQLKDDKAQFAEMLDAMRAAGREQAAILAGQNRLSEAQLTAHNQQVAARAAVDQFNLRMASPGDAARGKAAADDAESARQLDLARKQAADRAAEDQANMQMLQNQRRVTDSGRPTDSDGEKEKQKQLEAIDEEIIRLKESTELRGVEDAARVRAIEDQRTLHTLEDNARIESTTLLGGASDALREFVRSTTDAGAAVKEFLGSTLSTVNQTLVQELTTRSHGHPWRTAGHDIATSATSGLLKYGEGTLLKGLGIGKADGSSEGSAMWVRMAGAKTTSLSLPAGLGGAEGGGGGFFAGALKFAGALGLPGFADGVDNFGGGLAMVGEAGPELVNLPRGSSVVPNSKAFGNGGNTFAPVIDARGSSDPAQVEAAVHRSMSMYLPHLAKAMVTSQYERGKRTPTNLR